jgi:hypothetical protein
MYVAGDGMVVVQSMNSGSVVASRRVWHLVSLQRGPWNFEFLARA